jgi:hypothetical protein
MLTTGAIPILEAAGIEALVLAYSEWPFNSFSNFVPVLAPEQRYGVTWLRLREGGPRIKLLPAMSIADVLNHISFERWLLDLRELQVSGQVDGDLVLHMNFDTDVESWLPQELPRVLAWFPNAGGLREYIDAVDKYPWAQFTTPGEYLASHEPVGEVEIRQDTADGSYDGHASWAEKHPSHGTWTDLEASRLAGRRASAWLSTLGDGAGPLAAEVQERLWEGRESTFFQRLRGLSTTHFGMSTPVLNEERQAVARQVAAAARASAEAVERLSAEAAAASLFAGPPPAGSLAQIAAIDLRAAEGPAPATSLLRLPFVFDEGTLPATRLVDDQGRVVPHSWVNLETLGEALAAELWVLLELQPGQLRTLVLTPSDGPVSSAPTRNERLLTNPHLEVEMGDAGIASLRSGEWLVGEDGFLAPFLTYRAGDEDPRDARPSFAEPFRREALEGERTGGLARARLSTRIPFATPDGEAAARLRVDLTLPAGSPWLIADVDVSYPYTAKRDLLHTSQQKLRRYIDLRWIEVGPFPLTPRLDGTREDPLVVWKQNFLDTTASYPLNYGQINPRNAELDAFNHQITAGWVALSDGEHGFLIADRADVRTSFAFAPMRLRERDGRQVVSLNPFGTYHGRQLAYDHLGGNGVGTEFGTLGSSAVRPNGPSYNGVQERLSLLLAPYAGDAPPARLRADAQAFFHPPAALVIRDGTVHLPSDLRADLDARRLASARERTGAPPPPLAFLANPSDGAVDLVWDPPRDARLTGYEIRWRKQGEAQWQRQRIGRVDRRRIDGLANGEPCAFQMRALAGDQESSWTAETVVEVGPVEMVDVVSTARDAPLWLLLRTFWYGLVHVLTTP